MGQEQDTGCTSSCPQILFPSTVSKFSALDRVTGGASPTGMNQAVCFGATIVILLCEDTMMLGRGLCLCLFITQSSKTPGKLK